MALLDHLPSGQAGSAALVFAVVMTFVGFGLKRIATGEGELRTGYTGLLAEERKARRLAGATERRLARREEYARTLEDRLGIPHRVWDDGIPRRVWDDEDEGEQA